MSHFASRHRQAGPPAVARGNKWASEGGKTSRRSPFFRSRAPRRFSCERNGLTTRPAARDTVSPEALQTQNSVSTASAERLSVIIWAVPFSEADTRASLIDPAIHARGWSEDLICRETTLGAVEIIAGKRAAGRADAHDYTLRVRVSAEAQPVAVALIEAKKDTLPPGHGLDQAKGYSARHSTMSSSSSPRMAICSWSSTARRE